MDKASDFIGFALALALPWLCFDVALALALPLRWMFTISLWLVACSRCCSGLLRRCFGFGLVLLRFVWCSWLHVHDSFTVALMLFIVYFCLVVHGSFIIGEVLWCFDLLSNVSCYPERCAAASSVQCQRNASLSKLAHNIFLRIIQAHCTSLSHLIWGKRPNTFNAGTVGTSSS